MVMASDSSKVWKGNESINKNGKPENLNRKMCLDGVNKKCESKESLDWKLMIDPFLKGKAQMKVVRYAGKVDGSELPVVVRDPRDRSIQLRRSKNIDLPVPKFKYDKWSVGSPPLKSIFIFGLNDNVDQEFLTNLFQPLGAIDQLKVYYHHKTRRHLGIAYASFRTSSITKEVIAKYHGISIMGNIVSIKPDPLCQITKKALDCLTKNPQANIQEVIQSVHHKSLQKKTAAWAFKHNERSQNYYTARGKTKHDGEKHRDSLKDVRSKNITCKSDTPVKAEPKPKKEEEKHLVERKSKRPRDSDGTSAEVKQKSVKTEIKSPNNNYLATPNMDEKLKDIERQKKLYLADSQKYEDWKMKHELQIRADKTNRYIKAHYGEVIRPDKYKEYDKYYDKYYDRYRSSSSTGGGGGSSSRSSSKYYDLYSLTKYDKYNNKYSHKYAKYYDYYNEKYRKRKEYYGGVGAKDYEQRSAEYRDSTPLSGDPTTKLYLEHLEYSGSKYESAERPKSRQRSVLPPHERASSKRRRSYSPDYVESPVPDNKSRVSPTRKVDGVKGNGSSTSHDTGYNSISPALPSPNTLTSVNTINPYGCARAIPRKDISRLKTIGFKAEVDHGGSLSSSPMSLDEEQSDHEMEIEDISPHPQQTYQPSPQPPPVFEPLLPVGMPPFQEIYLPPPAPSLIPPFPFQTGQWLHATYPDQMYGQYYNPGEAADILARREAEKEAAKKQREMELYDSRRSRTIDDFINEMIMVLKKDTKLRLNEKVAFVKLEDVWNEQQEIKRREEELAAQEMAEQLKNDPNAVSNSGPAMLSLSEMRSISDAKSDSHIRHQSHVRQANLSFKVPKLSNKLGMRAQVIVKKTLSPSKLHEPVLSDDDVKDEDLLGKPSQVTSRYNTIYSSSDESQATESSASDDEEEEVEEAKVENEVQKKMEEIPEVISKPAVTTTETAEIKPVLVDEKYKPRSGEEEELVLEDVFRGDLVDEDKNYFKLAYELLKRDDDPAVQDTIWITPPEVPKPARRSRQMSAGDQKHRTGCARTEGYYKITKQEKMAMKLSNCKGEIPVPTIPSPSRKGTRSDGKQAARSTRAAQRRQATHYFDISDVQYLQLQSRRKMVRFQRSNIHEWGLFALEPISADEMVIEYVGEVIREIIADIREKGYERQGIGSSYMFRIDQSSYIVDATYRGSISRFINHNCDPNCYARVISVGSKKKVVIYSKRDIAADEEITYDYKFAIEDDENKIPCLCRATTCRGFLN